MQEVTLAILNPVRLLGSEEAYDEFNRRFLDWGWGDGFPLVPPTKE